MTDERKMAGAQWASEHATYEQLLALSRIEGLDHSDLDRADEGALGWGELFANEIFGEDGWSRSDIEDFCETWLGDEYPSLDAVRSFIGGAQEWFAETRSQIEA